MMNDFTKEELEEIQEIARHCCKQDVETKYNLTYDVKVKAQSMIENYCEHDGEIGKDYPAEKCMKCNAMWE